jgi:hypothetical protein
LNLVSLTSRYIFKFLAAPQDPSGQLTELTAIFPDCDPNYLWELWDSNCKNPDRVNVITNQLLEKRNYPKILKDPSPPKQEPLKSGNFSFDDFEKHDFYKTDVEVSKNYAEICIVILSNNFPMVPKSFIRLTMAKYRNHYVPSYIDIEKVLNLAKKPSKLVRKRLIQVNVSDEISSGRGKDEYQRQNVRIRIGIY